MNLFFISSELYFTDCDGSSLFRKSQKSGIPCRSRITFCIPAQQLPVCVAQEDFCFLFHPYISQKCDYHTDGYTMSYRRLLFMNPRGHREYHAQRIRLHKEGMVKSVICYISLSLFIRDKTMFSSSPNLIMTVLLYPLGCLKYLYDRYKLFVE